jgi:hypothetical protein
MVTGHRKPQSIDWIIYQSICLYYTTTSKWTRHEERTLGNAIASDGRSPLPIVAQSTKAFALLQRIHQYHVNTRRTQTVTSNHGAPVGIATSQRLGGMQTIHQTRSFYVGHDESGRVVMT